MEELTLYISEEVFTSFLQVMLTYGIGGAFAVTSIIIILTTIVYKAYSFISIKI